MLSFHLTEEFRITVLRSDLLAEARAIFFFGGVQLFFMGMIGEYILAIYGQVREKPAVFERERVNFPRSDPAPALGPRQE